MFSGGLELYRDSGRSGHRVCHRLRSLLSNTPDNEQPGSHLVPSVHVSVMDVERAVQDDFIALEKRAVAALRCENLSVRSHSSDVPLLRSCPFLFWNCDRTKLTLANRRQNCNLWIQISRFYANYRRYDDVNPTDWLGRFLGPVLQSTLCLQLVPIHDLSLNVCRDITEKNKPWKEVAEIVGPFSECT